MVASTKQSKQQTASESRGHTVADSAATGIGDIVEWGAAGLFGSGACLFISRALALHATYIGGVSYASGFGGADTWAGLGTGLAFSVLATGLEILPRQGLYFPQLGQAQAVKLSLTPILQPKSVATETAKTSSFLPTINKQNLAADSFKHNAVFWLSCGVYVFDAIQAFSGLSVFNDAGAVQIGALARAAWGVGGPELMLLIGSLFAYGRLNGRQARYLRRMQREAVVAVEQKQSVTAFIGSEPIPPYDPSTNARNGAASPGNITVEYPDKASADRGMARATAQTEAAGMVVENNVTGYSTPRQSNRRAHRTDRFAPKKSADTQASDGVF